MEVDKVILRAVLSTLAAIAGLILFMILTLTFVFPSTMMKITYDLGMDSASVSNAKRAYSRTQDEYYIAFATEVAIGADDDEEIAECGDLFIADEQFSKYCAARTAELGDVEGTYEQYVYGQVSVAKYRLGDKTGAVETAFAGLGESFPKNNAAVAVLLTALTAKDAQTVGLMKTKMNELRSKLSSETEKTYFEEMFALAQNG